MKITLFIVIFLLILPIILFYSQYRLCKKKSKFALILPTIVLAFSVIVGYFGIIISITMFLMYFITNYLEKEKQNKKFEMDKMNIEDL